MKKLIDFLKSNSCLPYCYLAGFSQLLLHLGFLPAASSESWPCLLDHCSNAHSAPPMWPPKAQAFPRGVS